jgi:RNA polymerase sigma factor (sigma-70 family)
MTSEDTAILDNIASAARIFEKHGRFIYSVICYKTSDESLVDDLFQDFFLALAAKPVSLDGHKLKAFLYRAIVNDIFDAVRRIKRYRNLLEEYAKNRELTINNLRHKNAYSIGERVELIMENAWELLSPKETKAISLRYLDGYSIAEVADKMKVKPESVSRYICVGLDKIRKSLSSNSGG